MADVEYVLVYPRIVDLRRTLTLWERPLGASRGRRLIQDDPTRFVGLRDYRPTDPLKHIDWKATARHGKPETRIYEPAADAAVADCAECAHGGRSLAGEQPASF